MIKKWDNVKVHKIYSRERNKDGVRVEREVKELIGVCLGVITLPIGKVHYELDGTWFDIKGGIKAYKVVPFSRNQGYLKPYDVPVDGLEKIEK